MSRAIIVYGSTMGNTEELANHVAELLEDKYDLSLKEVSTVDAEELKEYELILLGSSTWGAGELQDDFIDLYEELVDIDLSNNKAAVFGPGDRAYGDMFCQAVDTLEERLEDLGAEIVLDSFKWDGEIDDEALKEVKAWAEKL